MMAASRQCKQEWEMKIIYDRFTWDLGAAAEMLVNWQRVAGWS